MTGGCLPGDPRAHEGEEEGTSGLPGPAWRILQGDVGYESRKLDGESFDAVLCDPPYGLRKILVPFSGSGSEMIGALLAGWDEVVGIEREPEYVEIAEARLRAWSEVLSGARPAPTWAGRLLAKKG